MRKLSEPINGTEQYLAVIHEVLCDIRTALVDGGLVAAIDQRIAAALGQVADATHYAAGELDAPSPTKRTRTRSRTT